jgi:hypothetical protein
MEIALLWWILGGALSFFFLNPRRIKRNIWTFIISVIGGPITFFLALLL